jgi:hypothetical protein
MPESYFFYLNELIRFLPREKLIATLQGAAITMLKINGRCPGGLVVHSLSCLGRFREEEEQKYKIKK